MFDANNNYSPPDVQVRHVMVATRARAGNLTNAQRFQVNVVLGQVGRVEVIGHTQIAALFPQMAEGMALIEHATAKVGDVLTGAEVAAAVATQAVKLASVKASQEARAKAA